jgi:hypothetical protein
MEWDEMGLGYGLGRNVMICGVFFAIAGMEILWKYSKANDIINRLLY